MLCKQKPVDRAAEVVHLDDEKNVEDLHHDSDADHEADGGPPQQSRKDKAHTIPIFPGPRCRTIEWCTRMRERTDEHMPGRANHRFT